MSKKNEQKNTTGKPTTAGGVSRPPVVAVMGHVDHGKSTLLDYIRKTNIAEGEVGGITQNISAYEVSHKDEKGKEQKITFLDTPGHEAFSKMRERGAQIADIAILMVSAEDGPKPQTIEAWQKITGTNTPYIVAINKVDAPGANVERTKQGLAEMGVYLENYGGNIPFAEISAKTGQGVDDLLSLILILAEVEDFKYDPSAHGSGFVIEANLDPNRGIQATLVIKDGHLKKGMAVAVEDSVCSTRIMEDFLGNTVDELRPSSPLRIFGFSKMPSVGAGFESFENKKEAEKSATSWEEKIVDSPARDAGGSDKPGSNTQTHENTDKKIIPILLKADVAGSLEAIEKEVGKILGKPEFDNVELKIISKGVGPVSESDVKNISDSENTIAIGFNVKADKGVREITQQRGVELVFFDIIYKMTEWLEAEIEKRRPKIETVETTGRAKILVAFSRTKERQILGAKVIEGDIRINATVKIIRREFEIGRGKIVNLEKNKTKASVIEAGNEFGMMIESKFEIVPGDMVETFSIEHK